MTPPHLTALSLGILLVASSCAPAPRAIIPPASVVRELNVQPVAEAGNRTRDAVRESGKANAQAREAGGRVSDAARRLTGSIARAEALATANAEISKALAETRAFANELDAEVTRLTAALTLSEEKDRIALETIDSLISEIGLLKSNSAAQSVELRTAKVAETTLRSQVEALAKSAERLVIAVEKLAWWRKAAGLTWAMLAVFIIIRFFSSTILTYLRALRP